MTERIQKAMPRPQKLERRGMKAAAIKQVRAASQKANMATWRKGMASILR